MNTVSLRRLALAALGLALVLALSVFFFKLHSPSVTTSPVATPPPCSGCVGLGVNGDRISTAVGSSVTLELPESLYDQSALKLSPAGVFTTAPRTPGAPGDWALTLKAVAAGTATLSVPSKAFGGKAYQITLSAVAKGSTPQEFQKTTVITPEDTNKTVHLTKGEHFTIQLGDMKWSITFDPANIVTRTSLPIVNASAQGIYQANVIGTTTMRATGAPICTTGQACPLFLQNVTVTLVVDP